MAATYNLPDLTKGDTFVGRNMATIIQSSAPLTVSRALMEIRKSNGVLVYSWDTDGVSPNASITGAGNVVTIDTVDDIVTNTWSAATYTYELTVWYTVSGAKQTILKGSFKVDP